MPTREKLVVLAALAGLAGLAYASARADNEATNQFLKQQWEQVSGQVSTYAQEIWQQMQEYDPRNPKNQWYGTALTPTQLVEYVKERKKTPTPVASPSPTATKTPEPPTETPTPERTSESQDLLENEREKGRQLGIENLEDVKYYATLEEILENPHLVPEKGVVISAEQAHKMAEEVRRRGFWVEFWWLPQPKPGELDLRFLYSYEEAMDALNFLSKLDSIPVEKRPQFLIDQFTLNFNENRFISPYYFMLYTGLDRALLYAYLQKEGKGEIRFIIREYMARTLNDMRPEAFGLSGDDAPRYPNLSGQIGMQDGRVWYQIDNWWGNVAPIPALYAVFLQFRPIAGPVKMAVVEIAFESGDEEFKTELLLRPTPPFLSGIGDVNRVHWTVQDLSK